MSLPKQITSIEDVADFSRHLANDLNLVYHPDDSFTGLLDDPSLEAKLDALMDQCFDVCEANGADIYAVMGWPDIYQIPGADLSAANSVWFREANRSVNSQC